MDKWSVNCRTGLYMLRVEAVKNSQWFTSIWRLQLVINITKQKTIQTSLRELQRQRAKQDEYEYVNKDRKAERIIKLGDMVFVIKTSQMTGKLDSGMRGPYRVTRVLPHGRYSLRLLGGSYGKTTQAAAEHMVAWRGEWTPESCASFFDNEEDNAPGTPVTDSDIVSPPADDSQPGPGYLDPSALESQHAEVPMSQAITSENHANASENATTSAASDDVRAAGSRETR